MSRAPSSLRTDLTLNLTGYPNEDISLRRSHRRPRHFSVENVKQKLVCHVATINDSDRSCKGESIPTIGSTENQFHLRTTTEVPHVQKTDISQVTLKAKV